MVSDAQMTAPRPGKRARTRALLLANAIALFREQGVAETRLADVARAADVAPATASTAAALSPGIASSRAARSRVLGLGGARVMRIFQSQLS